MVFESKEVVDVLWFILFLDLICIFFESIEFNLKNNKNKIKVIPQVTFVWKKMVERKLKNALPFF